MKTSNFRQEVLSLSNNIKLAIIFHIDFLILFFSSYLAIFLESGSFFIPSLSQFLALLFLPFLGVLILNLLGVYKSIVRFLDFKDILILIRGLLFLFIISTFIIFNQSFFGAISTTLSLEAWIMGWLFSIILIVGSRILGNVYFSDSKI